MPLSLVKRLPLGVKMTPAQCDNNWTLIENAINGFAAQIAVVLDPLGNLNPGSVNTNALQDRVVTLPKLAFLSSFWALDTGAANALAISFTPALAAYVQGMVFWVKAAASNTGATTLNVNSVGPVPVKKFTSTGMLALAAGDIQITGEYIFVYDGTQFILLNPTLPSQFSTLFAVTPQLVKNWAAPAAWATIDISAWVPVTTRFAQLYCSGMAVQTGAAPLSNQFQTYFRSDIAGLVYQGLTLEGGSVGGTSVSFTQSGQFLVPTKVAGSSITFDAQLLQTRLSGATDTVSETLTLTGYST